MATKKVASRIEEEREDIPTNNSAGRNIAKLQSC